MRSNKENNNILNADINKNKRKWESGGQSVESYETVFFQ